MVDGLKQLYISQCIFFLQREYNTDTFWVSPDVNYVLIAYNIKHVSMLQIFYLSLIIYIHILMTLYDKCGIF